MYTLVMTKITLKNFIGIKTGLGKNELTVDFDKIKDKSIICILGDNGTGKSTFSSVLHPLVGTTDKRNKFIIEGKEGMKKIWYDRSDGAKYICKIVYSPSKTGHNAKGFFKKVLPTGEEQDLNPGGNITSYKDALFEEFGINDALLKLASQNDVCKGYVDMTSTERKLNMSTFLPDDIYSAPYSIADKIYKELRTRINVLVESIGRMHDDTTIELQLEKITKNINSLVEKRDKCIGKIKELETRIEIFNDNEVVKNFKKISELIKKDGEKLDDLGSEIKEFYNKNPDIDNRLSEKELLDLKNSLIEDISKINVDISSKSEKLSSLRSQRDDISDRISKKSLILKDISTDKSLNELKDILKSYKKKENDLSKLIKSLNSDITKNDLLTGKEIVKNIKESIDSICKSFPRNIIDDIDKKYPIDTSELDDLYSKKQLVIETRDRLINSMATLNQNSDLKKILDKRPKNCTIDDCPFIENACKWTTIEKEIDRCGDAIQDATNKLDSIELKIHDLTELSSLNNRISNLFNYINASMPILSKLPYNEEYTSIDSLLRSIRKGGINLAKCDDFEEFISIVESRDELKDLQFIKIPSIENEIKIIESQGRFIEDSKDELNRLISQKNSIGFDIDKTFSELQNLNNLISQKNKLKDSISELFDMIVNFNTLRSTLIIESKDAADLRNKVNELSAYKEKLSEKKERLQEIDDELKPLTRERELYKMEQLKIADNRQELAMINEDMYKCEIVRSALSVKDDGIPVAALEYFMDSIRTNANSLLSSAFNGTLYLEEFEVNTKDFVMPYKKNGASGMDVSYASSSERSFISLCLTLAIMEEITSNTIYGTVILDEIDRGFASAAKYKFIEILSSQIMRTGITQIFMVTHNSSFYDGHNIGYILFPGFDTGKLDDESYIKVFD